MDFKKLTDKAKDVVEKRGGTESVKEDAGELKDIFKGKGSLTEKAKEAAAAIKDPGAPGPDEPGAHGEAAGKADGAEGKHRREHERQGHDGHGHEGREGRPQQP